jgi:3-hydroxyacyl-CoA dehydrogenase
MREIRTVVVLGANGAMGSGAAEVFAAAGIDTILLARTRDKAQKGQKRAEKMAKSEAIGRFFTVGSYDEDLERVIPRADLIFEAVSEDPKLKKEIFDRVEPLRRKDAIVATVSSGLSIASMVAGRGESFRAHFLGIHLFNPPNVIVGCELIPHAGTDPAVTAFVTELLTRKLGRELTRTTDTAAFAGNRVGFKVLNECAQLAVEHGIEYIDALVGPHTGRAMSPLATVDFVGWDVHQAIVDNLLANTRDEAHDAFALPRYMADGLESGLLGDKTPEQGGFFLRKKGSPTLVLDPKSGKRIAATGAVPEIARKMRELHHVGRYTEAFDVFADATGPDATLLRQVILGYVSYGLNRVGEVVEKVADVDRIMGFGFNWAPPGALADLIGARRTVRLLDAAKLPVPRVLADAAERNRKLFDARHVDVGRFFGGAL